MPSRTAFCYAYVDDVARGHILAMEHGAPGETYIIAGECRSLTDVLRLAESITGIAAPRLLTPPVAMKVMQKLMAVVERVVPVPASYRAETLRVNAGTTYLGDNTKARRVLGYELRPLEDGLRETLAYEMAQLTASGGR